MGPSGGADRSWWARPVPLLGAVLVVAAVALSFVDLTYGVGLLGAAVAVASLTAAARALIPRAARPRLAVGADGVTWFDRRGEVVEAVRWDDVVRVRAWTDLVWMGNASTSYRHYFDVVIGPDERVRRTRYRRRSDPSLDDVLAQVRKNGVAVEDERRFGMIESVRRGR